MPLSVEQCNPHNSRRSGPYRIDVGLRDPFGNHIGIVQLKA
jgi:hypothetical protein